MGFWLGERRPLFLKTGIALMLIATSQSAIGDPLTTLDANRNHILEEAKLRQLAGGCLIRWTRIATAAFNRTNEWPPRRGGDEGGRS
jgi:hypothetical protein